MRLSGLSNPIVAKELRSRMRTIRSPLAITGYVLVLGGLGWAAFANMAASAQGSFGQAATYGQSLFVFLVFVQVIVLTFLTPAFTAGAISGERERQTIDLLFVTRLRPVAILWGKLVASMSFVVLLLLLSVPIFSMVFLFGGIELDQVVTAFLLTAVCALTLGALGLFCSTLTSRTLFATVSAYLAALLLVFGTVLWGLLFPNETDPQSASVTAPPAITYLSPIPALAWLAGTGLGGGFGVRTVNTASGSSTVCSVSPGGVQTCASSGSVAPIKPRSVPITPPPAGVIPSGPFAGWHYWQATVALEAGLSLLALTVSAILLPPVRRLPWRRAAVLEAR
jgi:ABC-2 type transport system permease protein